MAFKLQPGRSPFLRTGRNIPLQMCSPMHQQDVTDPTTGKTAKQLAQEKLEQKMKEAGPNTGDSKNVRNFEASASFTVPGAKVEKMASTTKEIEAYKKAKAKAESKGIPFGEKYKPKTISATATGSDIGADKPEVKEADNTSNKTFYWSNTNANFGSNAVQGLDYSNSNTIKSLESKNQTDTKQIGGGSIKSGTPGETGMKNQFWKQEATQDEIRLLDKGILPTGYNPLSNNAYTDKGSYLYGTKFRPNAEVIKNALEREKVVDAKVAKKNEIKAKHQAEVDKRKQEIAKKQEEAKAKKKAPLQQLKKYMKKK